MSGLRLVGLLLFWSGFLLASLAMVMQREIDLLPEAERSALLALDHQFVVALDQDPEAERSVRDLSEREFVATLGQWVARWESQQGQADARAATSPLTKATLIKRRTERVANLWPTIRWPPYLGALAVGFAGVILLRLSQQRAANDPTRQQAGLTQLRSSLTQVVVQVQALADQLPGLSPESVVAWIDDRCLTHCNDFADQREIMKERFGLAAFGEIMSEFASGERFLNRVWSAAADGYMEEAHRSVQTSLAFFQAAERQLAFHADGPSDLPQPMAGS